MARSLTNHPTKAWNFMGTHYTELPVSILVLRTLKSRKEGNSDIQGLKNIISDVLSSQETTGGWALPKQ